MTKSKNRILFLPKYDAVAASCRHRILQYLPYIDSSEIEYDVFPLFDSDYLEEKFSQGRASPFRILKAYIARFRLVLFSNRYDAVFLHCEVLPYLPAWVDLAFLRRFKRYILDLDDAIFHNYDLSKNPLVRMLLGRKFQKLFASADMIFAGGGYLYDYAIKFNSSVVNMPTVIDLDKYPLRSQKPAESSLLRVGWIGSPSTSEYLKLVEDALGVFSNNEGAPVEVILIGAGKVSLAGVSIKHFDWAENTEFTLLQELDVGIMPLPDTLWARGKCGFKLIQYMACGLPVVASPVGANKNIVEHGVNGFLASTNQEWIQALETLRMNPDLRRRMGQAGRREVEEKYCLQVTASRYVELLKSVLERR